jgi:hypothetical protein
LYIWRISRVRQPLVVGLLCCAGAFGIGVMLALNHTSSKSGARADATPRVQPRNAVARVRPPANAAVPAKLPKIARKPKPLALKRTKVAPSRGRVRSAPPPPPPAVVQAPPPPPVSRPVTPPPPPSSGGGGGQLTISPPR